MSTRRSPRNMCSVRHRPMPWAPRCRARAASSAVSALARTAAGGLRRRGRAAGRPRAPARRSPRRRRRARRRGPPRGSAPPVRPRPAAHRGTPRRWSRRWRARRPRRPGRHRPGPRRPTGSTSSASAPQTQVLPMPRATTAAWEVLPPRRGQDPGGGDHALEVVGVGLPAHQDHVLAAGRPRHRGGRVEDHRGPPPHRARRPSRGSAPSGRWPRRTAGTSAGPAVRRCTRLSASSRVISCSSTSWAAIRNAAAAVRLPTRVCSIHSLPRSMVNSMSHRSR